MKAMKKLLVLLALCAVLTCGVRAAESFNAKLEITATETQIIVTVQDSDVLLSETPMLSIPCDFPYATVTFGGQTVESELENGRISFSVAQGGQYLITKTGAPAPEKPDDEPDDGDVTPSVPSRPAVPSVGTSTTTKPDGTVVKRETKRDGTVIETTTKSNGEVTAAVKVAKAGKAVSVEIPVAQPTSGTVVIIVHPDGREEVVRSCAVTGSGVLLTLTQDAVLKIEDRSVPFRDVNVRDWEKAAVDFVSARELFSGTGDDCFSPDQTMTRGMILTVLARLDGRSTHAEAGQRWYDPGVSWAVTNALSDGSDPQKPVTREQLAVMLWRYAGSPVGVGSLGRFSDGSQSSQWAADALRWAVGIGILKGNPNGTLQPKGQATRAQVAQMLMNYVTVQAKTA